MIVDWSAAGTPKTGRDSIWICAVDRDGAQRVLENPPTRQAAKSMLCDLLADAVHRGQRVLAGFDFPFGYPAGFAARLGLSGTPWRAVWDEIAGLVEDDERNRNNRFAVGALLNCRVSGGRFPFWGCPAGFTDPFLGPTHHGRHDSEGLAEKRLIDRWMTGAQPCWKLAYTGSVGSQALTGIPVVRVLRENPGWADRARIWPLETGFRVPDEARIVFAEVWPSWWKVRPELGPPNDKAQVRTVAEIFATKNRTGELTAWFACPADLTDDQRRVVETEEAWTLGVTAPRRAVNASSAARSSTSGSRLLRYARNDAKKDCHCEEPAGLTRGDEAISIRSRSQPIEPNNYSYLRDPDAIYRRSFALIREEADLARIPASLRPVALRLAHAGGDVSILADLAWSRGAAAAGRRALANGAAIFVDSAMVAAGITADRLPAANPVICTLRDPAVAALAAKLRTTRSAAAVELWRPPLAGAVVAIGNAPTALFHLLEIVAAGAGKPALVLGFPVGFVGAAEAKEALAGFGRGLSYVTLRGRRGGSALAAAAVNALCGKTPA